MLFGSCVLVSKVLEGHPKPIGTSPITPNQKTGENTISSKCLSPEGSSFFQSFHTESDVSGVFPVNSPHRKWRVQS